METSDMSSQYGSEGIIFHCGAFTLSLQPIWTSTSNFSSQWTMEMEVWGMRATPFPCYSQ